MSAKKHSILMITEAFRPNIGGLETHLEGVCEYLDEKGHKVYVVTYQPLTTKVRGMKFEKTGNVEIHRVQWFGVNWRHKLERFFPLLFLYECPGLFFKSLRVLYEHRREIDVIDAQGLITAFIAKVLARLFRKHSVVSVHAIFGFENRRILRALVKWVLGSFDVILPFARKTGDELLALGLPPDKITPYVSWVDLDIFKPATGERSKKELGLEGKFVVLFIGRLIEKKGARVLLDASAKLNSDITFMFVGDGPMTDILEERAEIQPNIVFPGKVANRETPRFYNAADVFAFPSQYAEQFGVVVLESLACGTPIIAADRGGIPEVMDSTVGVFIEPTAENFARTIEHYYRNPDELAKLAANCRPYAESRYSRNNMSVIETAYDNGRKQNNRYRMQR
jgi:glycosyltransferase involved in cell wall biosynthesis